jgi:hypothetical protein
MKDRLQDGAAAISDVSILPVVGNSVGREVPTPKTQLCSTELGISGSGFHCFTAAELGEAAVLDAAWGKA